MRTLTQAAFRPSVSPCRFPAAAEGQVWNILVNLAKSLPPRLGGADAKEGLTCLLIHGFVRLHVLHGDMDIAEMPFQRIGRVDRVCTRRVKRNIDRPHGIMYRMRNR